MPRGRATRVLLWQLLALVPLSAAGAVAVGAGDGVLIAAIACAGAGILLLVPAGMGTRPVEAAWRRRARVRKAAAMERHLRAQEGTNAA